MNGQFGTNLGNAVAEALEHKGATLKEAPETVRLVGIQTHNVAPGKMTVPATKRQQGVIIVGPQEFDQTNRDTYGLIKRSRAYRWVLNPVRLDNTDRWKIRDRCSIVPANRVSLTCEICGNESVIWSDQLIRSCIRRRGEARKHPGTDLESPDFSTLLCKKCKDKRILTELERRPMKNTMMPARWAGSDPVFDSVEDHGLNDIVAAWVGTTESVVPDEALLPRVWAVYPANKAPSDWAPTDPKAKEIERRVRMQKGTIRPFHIARKAGSKELRAIIMEAHPTLTVGWVKEADLYGGTKGYKRCMVKPPKTNKFVV
jgi:hypothetical protein